MNAFVENVSCKYIVYSGPPAGEWVVLLVGVVTAETWVQMWDGERVSSYLALSFGCSDLCQSTHH